ncbi:phosphate/phosphite/phosphonate ABC transporter substrate-binding protein [Zhihengliuella flava]|uniref:Phosphonate transport system substrate-binding protein n=1 Tax=Zhihengliuella flava TaxID=1285193 RepID=A0A931D633_9MICC|nr:phosphate/phosphite/phosphonate ABC transporter substrate-binding protein [Zhihengliuella flava]MBG6085109.1 phosphonate transport system substrate-binding protein [Zhihengliuella flava]
MSPLTPRRLAAGVTLAAAALSLTACGGSTEAAQNPAEEPIVFAMPPGTDDPNILKEFELLQDMIGEATERPVQEEMPADYLGVVEALRQDHVDVAILSPFATSLAIKNGSVDPLVVWKASDDPASTCYSLKESGIDTVEDVAGTQVAFVDPGSTTGYFMPAALLSKAGLTDGEDYESTFAGGHDSALLAVANGSVDVACSSIMDMLGEAGTVNPDDFQAIGQTDPIPVGIAVVVSPNLDEATRTALLEHLPEAITGNPDLTSLGGNDEYILEPGLEPFQPLLDAADAVGLNLEDMR